jgi:hypothetical protein
VFQHELGKHFHQRAQSDGRHGGNEFVEHAPLAEQGMRAGFDGVGLEMPVHSEGFTSRTEKCQQQVTGANYTIMPSVAIAKNEGIPEHAIS